MDEDQKANPNPTPMETHWAVVALDKAHQELEEKDAEIAALKERVKAQDEEIARLEERLSLASGAEIEAQDEEIARLKDDLHIVCSALTTFWMELSDQPPQSCDSKACRAAREVIERVSMEED